MDTCASCNNPLRAGAKFCPECGVLATNTLPQAAPKKSNWKPWAVMLGVVVGLAVLTNVLVKLEQQLAAPARASQSTSRVVPTAVPARASQSTSRVVPTAVPARASQSAPRVAPTAVPSIANADQAYLNRLGEISEQFRDAFLTSTALTNSFSPDQTWINNMKQAQNRMIALHDEAIALTPPARYRETHDMFTSGTGNYAVGALLVLIGLDFLEDGDAAKATGYILAGAEQWELGHKEIKSATSLLLDAQP